MVATESSPSPERILRSALSLFSEKGYDATSVREICEASGITKPTLYHFYGSKEGVYRALIDGALERMGEDITRALEEDGSLADRLRRLTLTYFEATRREPDLARFILALVHGPPGSAPHTDLLAFYDSILTQVAGVMAAAEDRGELSPGPADVDDRQRSEVPHRRGRRRVVEGGSLDDGVGQTPQSQQVGPYLLVGRPDLTPELADTLIDVVLKGWTDSS